MELMVEWTRKTLIKKFPQMNMTLQTQINALKARKVGGPKKVGKFSSLRTAGDSQLLGNWMGTDSRTHWRVKLKEG